MSNEPFLRDFFRLINWGGKFWTLIKFLCFLYISIFKFRKTLNSENFGNSFETLVTIISNWPGISKIYSTQVPSNSLTPPAHIVCALHVYTLSHFPQDIWSFLSNLYISSWGFWAKKDIIASRHNWFLYESSLKLCQKSV